VDERLRKAQIFVMGDTVAQGVKHNLDKVLLHGDALGTRWIWELIQNARDAATSSGAHISIEHRGNFLKFSHDGNRFSPEEAAHLIYHGSTKVELEGKIGRYGSGFITTHLLARKVGVEGQLDDGRPFKFSINRAGDSIDSLRNAMVDSYSQFDKSLSSVLTSEAKLPTTFTYELAEEKAAILAKEGLAQLRSCGALVLTFSPEIKRIEVTTDHGKWTLRKQGERSIGEKISSVVIECDGDQAGEETVYLVSDAEAASSALPFIQTVQGPRVNLSAQTPRLFILFPLIGTERIGFPAVVNSRKFHPEDDKRDAVMLTGSSDKAIANRQLVESAIGQIKILLEHAGKAKCLGMAPMLVFDPTVIPDWVDRKWRSVQLASLIQTLRTATLVRTLANSQIALEDAWIPYGEDEAARTVLHRLLAAFVGASSRLPEDNDADHWAKCIRTWIELSWGKIEGFPEAQTIERLAQTVDAAGTVKKLSECLDSPSTVLVWSRQLLELVIATGKTKLLDDRHLLPSQTGELRVRKDIFLDGAIDDRLKDIGEALGVRLRARLLDPSIASPAFSNLLTTKSEIEALEEIIAALKARSAADSLSLSLIEPCSALFWWMCDNGHETRLDGFPVPSSQVDDTQVETIELAREVREQDRPLSPMSTWPSAADRFVSLFPARKILNKALKRSENDGSVWANLSQRGFIHIGPFHQSQRQLSAKAFLPDDSLNDGAEENHHSKERISVSDIAYLAGEMGMLDGARDSKTKAIQILNFVVDIALGVDPRAFERIPVPCICGETHNAFRGAWLMPLRTRTWVPVKIGELGPSKPTADSLAVLLKGQDRLVAQLSEPPASSLLEAFGIARSDFALRGVSPDEDVRVSLIKSVQELHEAANGDAAVVRELADEIRDHPEVIEQIREQKQRREKVRRNQHVGALVEALLRQELEAHHLTVRRTGMGSDFEVENDIIENGHEVVLEIGGGTSSVLIEVKSTRGDVAKMTPLQAETACREHARFALCVVAIEGDDVTSEMVKEGSRFLFQIGTDLAPVLQQYQGIQSKASEARQQRGPIELDMTGDQYRFRVAGTLWRNGMNIVAAAAHISSKVAKAPTSTPGR
jgi:hypothetical protein